MHMRVTVVDAMQIKPFDAFGRQMVCNLRVRRPYPIAAVVSILAILKILAMLCDCCR
jgi:hypothetical protein